MGLSPTATEATDDTPLGNGFLGRVRRLRQNVSRGAVNTARRTKDAMIDLKEDAGSMLSSIGDDFALKIEELDGQTDISDNWKEVCKEKAYEEHRHKLEEQAMERAKRDADRSVSADISDFVISQVDKARVQQNIIWEKYYPYSLLTFSYFLP